MNHVTNAHSVALIVGAGAIGGFYGWRLALQGMDVSVVCRSEYDTVREQGFRIMSPLGDGHFQPRQVLRTALEFTRIPDFVFVCVKILPDTDRIALIRPAIHPGTAIVLIQNGIGIEEEFAQAFPDNEIISGVAFINVMRTSAGIIHHRAFGSLALGNYPKGASNRVRQLAALFQASGVPCAVTSDIGTSRWQKSVWNAVFNPISILGGGMDTQTILASPAGEVFVRQAMEEVCQAAQAAGHPLPLGIVDLNIVNTRNMGAYQTSMAIDFLEGRETEIEAVIGNVIRAARKTGTSTPALDAIYALAGMIRPKCKMPL